MTIDAASRPMRILLTGGRSPVALELARLFHSAGHAIFAAECVPFHLCRVSRCVERSFNVPVPARDPAGFVNGLRAIAMENDIDVLVPTCEEIFHIAKEIHRLDGVCQVFAAGIDDLDRLHHKGKFVRLVEQAGLPAPATEWFDKPDGWLPLLADPRFHDGLVLKPAYSRFAARVIKIDLRNSDDQLHSRMKLSVIRQLTTAGITPETPWIIQEWLRGEEWCTYSVAREGELTAFAAYRSRFRAGKGASIHYASESHPLLREWVRLFVRHIGFTGQIAFDFMVSPGGSAHPMECNPRATSGIHLFGPSDRLAEAMLSPDELIHGGTVATPEFGEGKGTMLSVAMLTFGLTQAVQQRRLREWIHAYRGSRDAVYRREDARPFFEQFRLLTWAFRTARQRDITMQQALTADMEWNGDR